MLKTESPLHQQNLSNIIEGCREESQQDRDKEKGFCYELFRRALKLKDNQAWEAVQKQYNKLVLKWLYQKSSRQSGNLEDLQQETWARFWRTLDPRAETITSKFTHVGALLNYLNRCAWAAVVDEQRRQKKQHLIEKQIQEQATSGSSLEHHIAENSEQTALLTRVQAWIEANVDDAHERLVLQLSYEQGLTPKQIAEQYPDDFPDAKSVHRVKERLLKRIRYQLT